MASFTLIELHLDDASFAADRPFSNLVDSAEDEAAAIETDETEAEPVADDTGGSDAPTRGLAALGVVLVFAVLAAAVRHLSGEDPDVAVETDDGEGEPVDLAVDE